MHRFKDGYESWDRVTIAMQYTYIVTMQYVELFSVKFILPVYAWDAL